MPFVFARYFIIGPTWETTKIYLIASEHPPLMALEMHHIWSTDSKADNFYKNDKFHPS
jgi:hypothetical protein